jgi:cell division inhibitor SepF
MAEGGFWKRVTNFFTESDDEEEIIEEDYADDSYNEPKPAAVYSSLPERSGSVSSTIWVYQPSSFSFDVDSSFIGARIKDGYIIILNLQDLDDTSAQRLIDFVSGALYSVEGKLKAISSSVFLLVPKNVKVESFNEGFGTE